MSRPRLVTLLLAVALLALPGAATAADTGSIDSIRDIGNGRMMTTVTMESTSCAPSGFCGWYGFMVERHSTLACKPFDEFTQGVVPLVENDKKPRQEVELDVSPFFPRQAKLCLYLDNAVTPGPLLVDEMTYSMPAGYGSQRSSGLGCIGFGIQRRAQYYLYLYPDDPSFLAFEGNGIACPFMPCPCGAEWIPPEPDETPPPAVLPPPPPGPSAECRNWRSQQREAGQGVEAARRMVARKFGVNERAANRWRKILKKRRAWLKKATAGVAQHC